MKEQNKKIKIFIFDDHDSVRQSYKRWLEVEGFEVVGEGRSVKNCVQDIKKTNADIVLMDIDFPEKDKAGFDAAKVIKKQFKDVKIIFVSHYNEPEVISEAFVSGADGYFSKSDEFKFLIETIEKVSNGYLYTSPTATKNLIDAVRKKPTTTAAFGQKGNFHLTQQEQLVIKYIAEGLTNKEIAQKLATNEKRVKNIIANILVKLEAKNRAHAVAKLAKLQAIDLSSIE
jgi:DNA-binding NarL/FixJ family response regulator